jgi:CRISPR-associated protein Csc3
LLFDLCDGKPSRLKRLSNNFSDGFYAATLQLIRDESADDEDAPSAADQTEAEDN